MMASEDNASNSPISLKELNRIATEACDSTLQSAKSYDHTLVSDWNSQIINKVLQNLIQSSTKQPESTSTSTPNPPYRFNVNSTIVQQAPPTTSPESEQTSNGDSGPEPADPSVSTTSTQTPPSAGKRGMHSASGAYWDVKRDGMWTYKYSGAEDKGMDVVLSVIWFATG